MSLQGSRSLKEILVEDFEWSTRDFNRHGYVQIDRFSGIDHITQASKIKKSRPARSVRFSELLDADMDVFFSSEGCKEAGFKNLFKYGFVALDRLTWMSMLKEAWNDERVFDSWFRIVAVPDFNVIATTDSQDVGLLRFPKAAFFMARYVLLRNNAAES